MHQSEYKSKLSTLDEASSGKIKLPAVEWIEEAVAGLMSKIRSRTALDSGSEKDATPR